MNDTRHLNNTATRFGWVAIGFHWIMALMITALVIVGLLMTRMPDSPEKFALYDYHKETGILVLMLAVVRLSWRLRSITPSLAMLPKWEALAARVVHGLFYVLMLAQPITGWLMSSAGGYPFTFFGLFTVPALISENHALAHTFNTAHEILGYAIIATFTIHVLAALKHHFWDKDNIMRRMLKP